MAKWKPRCEHGRILGGAHLCRPCIAEAFAIRDRFRAQTATHSFPLRPGFVLRWTLPIDLTRVDVGRITAWLETLVLPAPNESTPPEGRERE